MLLLTGQSQVGWYCWQFGPMLDLSKTWGETAWFLYRSVFICLGRSAIKVHCHGFDGIWARHDKMDCWLTWIWHQCHYLQKFIAICCFSWMNKKISHLLWFFIDSHWIIAELKLCSLRLWRFWLMIWSLPGTTTLCKRMYVLFCSVFFFFCTKL